MWVIKFLFFITFLIILLPEADALNKKERAALRKREKNIKKQLDEVLPPLKIRSYRFKQTPLKIEKSKINLKKGYIYTALVPSGTPLQNVDTNEILEVGRPFNSQIFVPREKQQFAFLLNKKQELVYRTRTSYLQDLTNDLKLAPEPTHYVEHPPQLKTNIIDHNLIINTNISTHLGMTSSNYFLDLTGVGSALSSGFSVQTMFHWKKIKPLLCIDYSTFTLNGTTQSIFSAWKYGVGAQYQLPWFETPTNIELTVLADLSYKADVNATNKLKLSSNSIRLGLTRQSSTRFFKYSYGLDLERENISFISGYDLGISAAKENIFTLRAFIGIDFDFIL